MPDIQWRITSSSVNFPKELAIIVEGNETYDSCKYQRDIIFTTDGSKTTFSLRQYIYPKKNFKLEIIDRGEDCKNNAIFFSGDSVEYKTSESNDGSSYYYTVDVKLNN